MSGEEKVWIHLDSGWLQVAGCCEPGNERYASIKSGEFLDSMRSQSLLNKVFGSPHPVAEKKLLLNVYKGCIRTGCIWNTALVSL
jgi:hypothetical protein